MLWEVIGSTFVLNKFIVMKRKFVSFASFMLHTCKMTPAFCAWTCDRAKKHLQAWRYRYHLNAVTVRSVDFWGLLHILGPLRSIPQSLSQIRFPPDASSSSPINFAVSERHKHAMIIAKPQYFLSHSAERLFNASFPKYQRTACREFHPQRHLVQAKDTRGGQKAAGHQILSSDGLTRARRFRTSVVELGKRCQGYQQYVYSASAADAAANLQGRTDSVQGEVRPFLPFNVHPACLLRIMLRKWLFA